MKRIIMLVSVVCIGRIAIAQDAYTIKSFAANVISEVESATSGGNISLEKTDGDQRVEVYVYPANRKNGNTVSKEEIEKRLAMYDMTVAVNDGKLTAIARPRQHNMKWKDGLSISFKIFVSQSVKSTLTTSGGNIGLTGITGNQDVTTSGGNISVRHVKGKIKGITSGGNIDVQYADDDIDLTTSGGNINAENCKGHIKLSTSGGNVILKDLSGDVAATTSGGDVKAITIGGELAAHTSGGNVVLTDLSCNLSAGTSGGNVSVSVKEPGKFVKLSNSGGKIELRLPAQKGYDLDFSGDKIKTDGLVNFTGKAGDDELKGTVNGGGTKVTVNAGSSKILLTLN